MRKNARLTVKGRETQGRATRFHKGPAVTAIERRGGCSYVLEREREATNERLAPRRRPRPRRARANTSSDP